MICFKLCKYDYVKPRDLSCTIWLLGSLRFHFTPCPSDSLYSSRQPPSCSSYKPTAFLFQGDHTCYPFTWNVLSVYASGLSSHLIRPSVSISLPKRSLLWPSHPKQYPLISIFLHIPKSLLLSVLYKFSLSVWKVKLLTLHCSEINTWIVNSICIVIWF